ncbi:DUF7261 family protein [Halogeometricum borinquense]|uniref:DUF7261 family protein n=1 Tax=Halogeometricum borinquense TaxID=60847 RepID=UPI001F4D2C76|nr:hypothetical protein [Halogeometricum borinquense]
MTRDRGQVVLLAAVVVAVALVPMALAYAQLGYDTGGDEPAAGPGIDGARRALSSAFTGAAVQTDGAYHWSNREAAVSTVRDDMADDVTRVENAAAATDRSLVVSYNDSEATGWAVRNCPDGRGREFGPCEVEDGIVIQQRANETAVVAAALDLDIVAPDERTNATVVVRAV